MSWWNKTRRPFTRPSVTDFIQRINKVEALDSRRRPCWALRGRAPNRSRQRKIYTPYLKGLFASY